MMSSNNQMSKDQFINQIAHPRKKEMAKMILDGASLEELQAQNFGRTNVQEMVAKIKVHVAGLEEFKVGGIIVTQEILDENQALKDAGVQVGDIGIPTDLGPSDSGSSDSGSSDSGPSDSGPSDSGSDESGSSDSGSSDSGPSDSGSSESKTLV